MAQDPNLDRTQLIVAAFKASVDEIRRTEPDLGPYPFDEDDEDAHCFESPEAFVRMLDESLADGLHNGCVSREQIERDTEEAIRLGLEDRERDRLAALKRAG